ncbi:hypothetical protein [Corynebacterium sp.]|uniref:hypothetical protein n=1 Tax=Corynebacterium sp. TaxID=1720 RepID=UPI0026DAB1E4|nr:hypothetical protein [Corynebacterium sp.]MDO5031450.1 hypothetical protein [Corynebacterium sp.]
MNPLETGQALTAVTAGQLGAAYGVYCAIPAGLLAAAGLGFHFWAGRRDPSFYGDQGLRLRHVIAAGALCGMLTGAAALLPLPFEISSVLVSALVSVCASLITWSARESISGAFLTVATMMLAATGFQSLCLLGDVSPATTFETSYATFFAAQWALLGLPAAISAGIAAVVNRFSLAGADPTHGEDPSGWGHGVRQTVSPPRRVFEQPARASSSRGWQL